MVVPLAGTQVTAVTPFARASAHLPSLYSAEVTHTRRAPITNRFRYKVSYWLVDYDRLPRPGRMAWRFARVERSDHSDVRIILAEHGVTAERILMLAMARTLGYVFNPISVFWCYDAHGASIAILAEVHNTYGGRHVYFLRPDQGGGSTVDKALYVSPFYPVDGYYDIRVSEPGVSLSVTVTLHRENDVPFVASLMGARVTTSNLNIFRASFVHSAIRTSLLIRRQAVSLWLRGLRVQPR